MEIMGFSVVEPMNLMTPFSMAGRMVSLWARVHRWHSSNSTMVATPYSRRSLSAWSMMARISLTPVETALIRTNRLFVVSAMMLARVVVPQPGGP